MLETKREPISIDLPACTCGCRRYTKVRSETMQTVFEHIECNECHTQYLITKIRKENAFREEGKKEDKK